MKAARARVAALMLADAALMALVWAFVIWAYRASGLGHYKFGAEFYLRLWPGLAAFVALNAVVKLYHGNLAYPAAPINPVEELRRLVYSAIVTHLGVIAALALANQSTEHYSRAVIVLSGLSTAALAQPFRNLVRAVIFRLGAPLIPVALTGSGELASRVERTLASDPFTGFRVALRDDGEGDAGKFAAEAKRLGVRVLVTTEDARLLRCRMSAFAKTFTHIVYIPTGDSFPVFGAQAVSIDSAGGLEMVNQRSMKFTRLEKWLLDKTLAVIAFAMLSPFFVLVPLAVKLTSRGPVFYRQKRLGKKGREIRVWKFRSMYADADERLKRILAEDPARRAEWEANFKLADDPRVTPLGRFLRKTSIDEFPQLFNVFSGEMALVGPRPIVRDEVKYYGGAYSTFASVKPGITGLWQASGRSDTDYARRVALDVQYVLNWSPWMDIWILFRTIGAVLFMRGAR